MRGLVGRGNAGEIGDLIFSGAPVQAFDVALFADCQRAVAENLDEVGGALRHHPHPPAVLPKRRDERGQHDQAAVHEQFGQVPDAADVFGAVGIGKTEVAAQTVADVVAVADESPASQAVQLLFNGVGESRFSAAGQPGEPQDDAGMTVLPLAPAAGDGGVMPDAVGGFGLGHGCGLAAFTGVVMA